MLHHVTYVRDENAPWVTFVHGAGGSSSIWFRQLKAFKREFNVLLLDLRGHGKSKKGLGQLKRYNFEVIGDEVIDVLNHLGIVKSHFVGISLGTIIIRDIAERFPERMSAMVMAGAVMKLNLRGQVLMRLGVIFKSILPYLLLYRFFAFIIMPKKAHKKSRSLFINEAKKLYQNEFKKWFTLAAEVNPLLAFFRFKDSGIATLYIMGEEDHMFLPSIKKLVRDHQSAQLQVVANSGHVVNVDQPLEFNKRVIAYLAQV